MIQSNSVSKCFQTKANRISRSRRRVGRRIGKLARKIFQRGTGPSGKPLRHFKDLPNRKAAENAARNAGKGNKPIEHKAHKPGQKPHYHPTDKKGKKKDDGSHYRYPPK